MLGYPADTEQMSNILQNPIIVMRKYKYTLQAGIQLIQMIIL